MIPIPAHIINQDTYKPHIINQDPCKPQIINRDKHFFIFKNWLFKTKKALKKSANLLQEFSMFYQKIRKERNWISFHPATTSALKFDKRTIPALPSPFLPPLPFPPSPPQYRRTPITLFPSTPPFLSNQHVLLRPPWSLHFKTKRRGNPTIVQWIG